MRFATPLALVTALCVAAGFPATAKEAAELARVETAFTPGDDIAGLLVEQVRRARDSVQVQAYLFTDRRLANALAAALKRGVSVEVVADAAQHAAGGSPFLASLHRGGAKVFLNSSHAAAHDKIVIVDGDTPRAAVITGSYNFTRAAQSKNAENVVVITANRSVTDRFVRNFESHRNHSIPWP